MDGVDEDETLQYDPTAYQCLHSFSLDWACLRSAPRVPKLRPRVRTHTACIHPHLVSSQSCPC